MTNEEANLTIDYLKEMQEGYIEGEGYERHPLPEWYALDKAIEVLEWAKWIPVSERLPEDRMACLVYGKMHFVPDHVDEKNWFYDYSIGCFNSAFGWSIRGDMEVIAWMPLPSPYQPQERSEDGR